MKFEVERDTLLNPLLAVQGVIERRQTLPVLANVLITTGDGNLSVTATDMEIELQAQTPLDGVETGQITVPARKLVDICRTLAADARIRFELDGQRVRLVSGRSRFMLSTLPAIEFPATDPPADEFSLSVPQLELKQLLELTQFAMAQQDVRYYLNGLLLEISADYLRAVATDGHRLAAADLAMEIPNISEVRQIIVPRKAVLELQRMLGMDDKDAKITIGSNALRLKVGNVRLTSKLIDGKFPDYGRVIPRLEKCDKQITIDRQRLIGCLNAASVLSSDKYRAVRLALEPSLLRVVANNPEQEEAKIELEIDYAGEAMEIGFNVNYMIQALNVLPADNARLCLTDSSSSCLLLAEDREDCRYVVMPMRL